MMEEKDMYIESVVDYLNALPQNEEFSDTLLDKLTLFRGQGNKEWDLMPSVMRNREDYLNEELYIKECIRQYPEEFINMSKIDMLIKMQHYGVPTRLLDLTKNPLIALYFACVSEPNKDGVVYAICGPIARSSDLYVTISSLSRKIITTTAIKNIKIDSVINIFIILFLFKKLNIHYTKPYFNKS